MRRINARKLWLARLLGVSGLSSALLWLRARVRPRHLRIVNYHDVPAADAEAFEWQLRLFARTFHAATPADLRGLLDGSWPHDRPGIVITFDDGLRSHYEIAAPLLEKHGFVGWFFVPAALPALSEAEQATFAIEQRLALWQPIESGRVGMTLDEVRDLARRHVVGCHTMNHRRLHPSLSAVELEQEIVHARRAMERDLDRPVTSFCWVGGEEDAYSSGAAEAVRRAGFELSFMTNNQVVHPGSDPLQLQRTNIEAFFPPMLTRFQLCGVLDWLYSAKRRRVNRLTAGERPSASLPTETVL